MDSERRTVALIVAAGVGARAGGDVPKQYGGIGHQSMLAHAIDALVDHRGIDAVQVVIGPDQLALYHAAIGDRVLPAPVIGGATRRLSVRAGLEAINADNVLIHDAARPFVPPSVIDRLLAALESNQAAIPVLRVVDTLVRGAEGAMQDLVDRESLFHVQTPQACRHDVILAAHRAWNGAEEPTDDAQMVRAMGIPVTLVEGDIALAKLTYPKDFAMAEQRLSSSLISRTAMGFDVHAFGEGDTVWLGGIAIPHNRALSGHSDADVALHAIVDALLGTIGAGDIGQHFPPSDPQWRGAASSQFLDHACKLVRDAGGIIDHIDLTIICEVPKIGPHRDAIRNRIAELAALPIAHISVKATTTEQLGFTGRGEGIAAQAVVTVRRP